MRQRSAEHPSETALGLGERDAPPAPCHGCPGLEAAGVVEEEGVAVGRNNARVKAVDGLVLDGEGEGWDVKCPGRRPGRQRHDESDAVGLVNISSVEQNSRASETEACPSGGKVPPEGQYMLTESGYPFPIDGEELARVSASNGLGLLVSLHGHTSKVGKEEL